MLLQGSASASDSPLLWAMIPAAGTAGRPLARAAVSSRVANGDWDCSPDGRQIAFVSADDKALWYLSVPDGLPAAEGAPLRQMPAPPPPGTNGKPYRLPFTPSSSPSTWYITQWYGVTTGGYRGRNSTYVQGQGIHFGVDFATAYGTPVVAIAPGTVIAVDGDYGSP